MFVSVKLCCYTLPFGPTLTVSLTVKRHFLYFPVGAPKVYLLMVVEYFQSLSVFFQALNPKWNNITKEENYIG